MDRRASAEDAFESVRNAINPHALRVIRIRTRCNPGSTTKWTPWIRWESVKTLILPVLTVTT